MSYVREKTGHEKKEQGENQRLCMQTQLSCWISGTKKKLQ